MKVTVILHSVLREKLPPNFRGKTTLELTDGATIMDVVEQLDLPKGISFSLNDEILQELDHPLANGDLLRFFRLAGGG